MEKRTKIKNPKISGIKRDKKKCKHKKRYTFMFVSSESQGTVRKLHLSAGIVRGMLVLAMLAVFTCTYGILHISGTITVSSGASQEVEELANQNLELTQQNTELTNKVAILSDTINQKVEEENAKEQEKAEKRMPTGFPLSGTASMKEANANEAAGPGAAVIPMLIFDSGIGTNVISSGDGIVSYVGADDTDYGNMIKIDHGNGYETVYRNAAKARVSEGDEIPRGTVLFQMEENSTRLGYEIINENQAIDPLTLLEIAG